MSNMKFLPNFKNIGEESNTRFGLRSETQNINKDCHFEIPTKRYPFCICTQAVMLTASVQANYAAGV